MRTLFSGLTRANTEYCSMVSRNSSSDILSRSAPSMTLSPSRRIPISAAMADAVSMWSPVIIMGRMPASLHTRTASFTSALGGSIMPTSPTKTSSLSRLPRSRSPLLTATPRTRSAFFAIREFAFLISSTSFSVMGRTSSPAIIETQRGRSISGAPLTYASLTPSCSLTVVMSLRTLSKGTSSTLGYSAVSSR